MSGLFRSKQEWRAHFKSSLEISGPKRETELQKNLADFLRTQSGIWGGFQSLPQEPSIEAVYRQATHLQWVFSRMQESGLCWYQPGTEGFEPGNFGVLQPRERGAKKIPMTQIQGFLIPGLGFDRRGVRLGWGKGFYDRALVGFQGLKIGVALSTQITDLLPEEGHDIKMDLVITDSEVIRPK